MAYYPPSYTNNIHHLSCPSYLHSGISQSYFHSSPSTTHIYRPEPPPHTHLLPCPPPKPPDPPPFLSTKQIYSQPHPSQLPSFPQCPTPNPPSAAGHTTVRDTFSEIRELLLKMQEDLKASKEAFERKKQTKIETIMLSSFSEEPPPTNTTPPTTARMLSPLDLQWSSSPVTTLSPESQPPTRSPPLTSPPLSQAPPLPPSPSPPRVLVGSVLCGSLKQGEESFRPSRQPPWTLSPPAPHVASDETKEKEEESPKPRREPPPSPPPGIVSGERQLPLPQPHEVLCENGDSWVSNYFTAKIKKRDEASGYPINQAKEREISGNQVKESYEPKRKLNFTLVLPSVTCTEESGYSHCQIYLKSHNSDGLVILILKPFGLSCAGQRLMGPTQEFEIGPILVWSDIFLSPYFNLEDKVDFEGVGNDRGLGQRKIKRIIGPIGRKGVG